MTPDTLRSGAATRVSEGEVPRKGSPGLAVLAACGFLVLSVVYLESAAVPGMTGLVIADFAFLIPIAVVFVLCGIAYRRSHGLERTFWFFAIALYIVLALSELYYLSFLLAGDVFFGTTVTAGPPPPIFAPFQVLHVAAAVIAFFLLASLVRLADPLSHARLRWFLDVAGVSAVLFVLCLKLMVDPLFAGIPNVSAGTRLIAAAYPTFGLLVGVGALWTLVRPGVTRWRLWERLIALSIVIYAAGTTAWPIWYVAFQPGAPTDERSLLDLILVLGHYLFVMGAAYRLMRPGEAWAMRQVGPVRRLPGRAATYIAIGIAVLGLPALVSLAVRADAGSFDRYVYAAAAALIAVTTVARTIVTASENGRLFKVSTTDSLTGLPGHRFFHEQMAAELELAERFGEPVSVMWADIDDFGRFNRLAGRVAGDEALQGVAGALRAAAGPSEFVCRIGGDEFAVIARGSGAAEARHLGERVRAALVATSGEGSPAVTVSVGVSVYPDHADDAPGLLRLARGTALWARLQGADRVLVYEPETVLGLDSDERVRAIEEETRTGTVRALAAAADARLERAGARASVVAELAVDLARRLRFDAERTALLETAALLHDVGMIALGDDVLTKPGPLTDAEMERVRRHPQLGERIVGTAVPEKVGKWIRHHHERWDGSGYPEGLRAAGIPLESRILAVCDAWAAMTSERPYREARTAQQAEAELRACASTQFDPSVVEALLGAAEEPGD